MNDDTNSLSVIIPVYNTGKYLYDCVESVLDQKISGMEIILVDDGSTDDSGEICDKLAESHKCIKTIHTENHGPSCARNAGLDVAVGEWIGFVDSDDQLLPGIYDSLLTMNTFGADVITMGRILLFEDGHTKKLYCHNDPEVIGREEFLRYVLTYNKLDMSPCDKLFHKRIFHSIKFPEGALCEDMLIIPDINQRVKKVLITGLPGYVYRQRSGSRTKSFDLRYIGTYHSMSRLKEYVEGFYPCLRNEYVCFEDTFICHIFLLYEESIQKRDEISDWFRTEMKNRFCRIMVGREYGVLLKMQAIFLYFGVGRAFGAGKKLVRRILKI